MDELTKLKKESLLKDKIMVIAIDIGTPYSSYANSFKLDFIRDPLKIGISASASPQVTWKIPTTALFDPDGTFHAFGYEAEHKYSELEEENEHHGWYYFKRIKIYPLSKKMLQRGMMLKDIHGREIDAVKLFSEIIGYFVRQSTATLSRRGAVVLFSEIYWVLPVSGTWNNSSRQFLTEAAEKAGIGHDQLMIVHEHVAALIYCSFMPLEDSDRGKILMPGRKYLVLDCGEAIGKLTLFEVQQGMTFKEVANSIIESCGVITTEELFVQMLIEIVGGDAMRQIESQCADEFSELLRQFRTKLIFTKLDTKTSITITLPQELHHLFGNTELIKESRYAGKLRFFSGKLIYAADIVKNFIITASEQILDHMTEWMKNVDCQGLDKIGLIGEFSISPIIQHMFKTVFQKKGVEVIIPKQADLAVLQGAVISGQLHISLAKDVANFSYSLASEMERRPYDEAQGVRAQSDWDFCMIKEHGSAKWKCINCGDYMCEKCKNTHMMGKKTRKHRLLHINEREKEDDDCKEVFCRIHRDKELDMYCITDKCAICAICSVTGSHGNHQTESLDKYADRLRSDAGLAVTNADTVFPQYNEHIEELVQRLASAKRITKTNCQRIDAAMQGVITQIKQKAANLRAEEERYMETMEKSLTTEIDDLRRQMTETKTTILDARHFLETCTEIDLIRHSKTYEGKLDMIKPPKIKTDFEPFTGQMTWDEIHKKLTKDLISKD